MQVAEIAIYPVKSTRGLRRESAEVEPAGLRHDRRWMVIDSGGAPVTARSHPAMFSITATPDDDGALTLTAPGAPALFVPTPIAGDEVDVVMSRLSASVSAGPAADAWVSAVLGLDVRLVWLDDPARRPVGGSHGGLPGDALSLADAGPLLLTTTASMRQLEEWIAQQPDAGGQTMSMRRFRPNVVVEGAELEPFAEDRWQRVTIGSVQYRFAEHCDRCVMTTIDPDSMAGGKEPMRTLSRRRRWAGKVWFGIRLIPTGRGRLDVGDPVTAVPTER